MGRFLLAFEDRWWFPVKQESPEHASRVFNRWGVRSLLFACCRESGDEPAVPATRIDITIFLPDALDMTHACAMIGSKPATMANQKSRNSAGRLMVWSKA